MDKKFGIYIHWPFCLSRCLYCDFFRQIKDNSSEDDIIEEYLEDLNFYHGMTSKSEVTSVFFGGGTPSLIAPKNIEKIINHIQKKWNISKNVEISLEANPNSNKKNMFSDLQSSGINRLSLGIQSLRDEDLKFLGRTHNKEQALKAIDEVLNTFDNHSMDMIYALPKQQFNNWQKDLEIVSNFGFKHISLYQLMIEEGTPFHKQNIQTMDDEKANDFYTYTSEALEKKGYEHYEISNFAKKGHQASHNLVYWQGYDYIGIGKSAHGRIGLKATTHKRKIDNITTEERATELLLMGLRISEGIDKNRFKEISQISIDDFINKESLNNFEKEELIINNNKNIHLTKKGLFLLDYIIERLV